MLTIVMYHYVRDAAATAFPRLNVRTTSEFLGQLDYLTRHYDVVDLEAVRDAYAGGAPLPPRACLLSFDDGLVEHLEEVAPALAARGLSGCFAIPAAAAIERRVLDVQKSQFVLAASDDHGALATTLLATLAADGVDTGMLRARYAHAGRYDGPDTMLLKRLLQDALPEEVRRRVLDELFAELVADDERAFADELYLSVDGARALVAAGMSVVGHGDHHLRLGECDERTQRAEIERSRELLAAVYGEDPVGWTLTYPYGSRNATTLRLLEEAECALALTTDVGLAPPDAPPLELPRLNTNDLPVDGGAAPAEWTSTAAVAG